MLAGDLVPMERYLDEVANGGNFTAVPMREDLRSTGPVVCSTGAQAYRDLCQDLARSVERVTVRRLVGDDQVVHAVYDLDLGLPTGPVASAETLTFREGVMTGADLVIDSTPLRPAP